ASAASARACRHPSAGALPPVEPSRAVEVRAAIAIAERAVDRRVDLAVDFGIGVDEVVQGRAGLRGLEDDLSPPAELEPGLVEVAEEGAPPLGMLGRLAAVDGEPASPLDIELGPAVVAGDLPFAATLRQRQADGEAGGDALRAGHGDDEGVEVGAVAPFDV